MKTNLNRFSSGFLVFIMSSLAGFSAQADDTEIFFNTQLSSEVKPNVVFILDNSQSMNSTIPNSTTKRIDSMKSAMNTLLSGLNNVNVGLMQFSFPGAAVIYPVTDIDTNLPYPVAQTYTIVAAENDAEEANSTVTNNNVRLAATERNSSGDHTISVEVTASEDDAEELTKTNTINVLNSVSLELPTDGQVANLDQQHLVGTIFRGLSIPAGALIVSAELEFVIQQNTTNAGASGATPAEELNLEISGQLAGSNAIQAFDVSKISDRTYTNTTVDWTLTGSAAQGDIKTSPNLVNVIQEIVDQAEWVSGNDIALQLKPSNASTADFVFASVDNNNSLAAPKLTITYEDGASTKTQIVGLRYENINIPQGARVTSAILNVTSASEYDNSVSYSIYGDRTPDSLVASDSETLGYRATTTATVNWTPGTWVTDQSYSSPDLKSIIQEIVSNGSWCGGDALTLMLSNGGGSRLISAYEDSPSKAPTLTLTYDDSNIPASGGCVSSQLTNRIDASADDGDIILGNGNNNNVLNNNYLDLGTSGSDAKMAGFRFHNILLPQNVIIQNAYLEFTAYADSSGASNLTISAENVANAAALGTANGDDINNRTFLSASVAWNSVPDWTTGTLYRTPDITSLVQPLVNRTDWVSNNAMFFAVQGTGLRKAVSHNGNPLTAPRLVINYESRSTGTATTPTKTVLSNIVNSITPQTYTPIVDALYEAALYFRGDGVHWGTRRQHSAYLNTYDNFTDSNAEKLRVSHADSYTGGEVDWPTGCTSSDLNNAACKDQAITGTPVYKSPIKNQCQTNHIVLLTDGRPSQNESEALIASKFGVTCDNGTLNNGAGPYGTYIPNNTGTPVSENKDICAIQLVNALNTTDQFAGITDTQNIKTHVIGFNLSADAGALTFLDSLAAAGGTTQAKTASNATDLVTAFKDLLGDILSVDTTFVSPGVTVNTFNRLTHRNEIYYALFKPDSKPSWPGNLKRYGINSSGIILDRDGNAAIDTSTGFFKDDFLESDGSRYTARSYWSVLADGKDVVKGGAAENLPSSGSRKVYTYYSGSASTTLSNAANALVDGNTNITKAMLGIGSKDDTYRTNLINWARGANADGTQRNRLADPLHSVPNLVTYGGDDANPDLTIFYGDNEGFLHAINASNGVEHFAFIPEELLTNLDIVSTNSEVNDHPYGMDGFVNAWVYDVNGDNKINDQPGDGDHVYVYAGMRRGGRSYYALDVTDRSNPKYLWRIQGGAGDFAELGQTWSKPVKTKVNISGAVKDVLIFTGGYDPNHDNVNVTTADSVGRAIYFVDATTGAKLWQAGPSGADENFSDMLYSIPASPRVTDMDGDGLADQIYVGDVGGQLWRFDINNGNPRSSLVTGGVIADVSSPGVASDRRFYHEPDVSVIIENNKRKLAITIGSGNRAHPLNTAVNDRMYMFKQEDVFGPPAEVSNYPNYVKIAESDLYDASENYVQSSDSDTRKTALDALHAAKGWYINLEANGEKMISTPIAVSGELSFTTYSPETSNDSCNPSRGTSRLYSVNTLDAGAVNGDTSSGSVDSSERHETLQTVGIPSDPVRLRISDTAGTNDILCVGTECSVIGSGRNLTKTYWYTE